MAGFEGAPLRRGAWPWRDREVVRGIWLGPEGVVAGAAEAAAAVNRRMLDGAALLQTGLIVWPASAVEACRSVDATRRDFMLCAAKRSRWMKCFSWRKLKTDSESGPRGPGRRTGIGVAEGRMVGTGQPLPAPGMYLSISSAENPGSAVFGVFRHFTCSLSAPDKAAIPRLARL